jgi:hypothetical protein
MYAVRRRMGRGPRAPVVIDIETMAYTPTGALERFMVFNDATAKRAAPFVGVVRCAVLIVEPVAFKRAA